MSQIALPFAVAPSVAPQRLVVGAANRRALAALADPATWPFRTAVLVGATRSGKTLLSARFAAAHPEAEVLDDADEVEDTLVFHAWNRAQESRAPLLLTARPGWTPALPDLASRLGGSLQLAIVTPDDAMIADLIAAHAEKRHLLLGAGAAEYLGPRVERSFAAVEEIVAAIDRISLERHVPATMSVWRDALESVQGPEQGRLL